MHDDNDEYEALRMGATALRRWASRASIHDYQGNFALSLRGHARVLDEIADTYKQAKEAHAV